MNGTGLSISASGLTLRHATGDPVLDGAAVEIAAGSVCALFGPSGSGKSSLLAALGGRLMPCRGRILLGETLLDRRSVARLRPAIGQAYQDNRLVMQATVLANVLAGLAPATPLWRVVTRRFATTQVDRAVDLLDRLGLDASLHHRRAGSLSGGQAQRVGVARALAGRPRLILADEPVANLDPQTARLVLDVIAHEARTRGTTVVCALHQPELATTFADRVLMLHEGRIQEGEPYPERSTA